MSNKSREHLSCFMDGEINKETSRFLVRRLGADSELRATWARYHLVRDCLRHQDGDLAGIGLCSRVQRAMANETQQTASRSTAAAWSTSKSKAGWLKPVVGMAVAASVALMAIIAVGPGQSPVSTPAGELAGSPQAESFVSPNNVLTRSPRPQQVSVLGGTGKSNQKMNSYLLRHYQVTGSTGGKGFVTFVPIVVTQAAARADAQADPEGDSQGDREGLAEEGEDSPDRASESTQQ